MNNDANANQSFQVLSEQPSALLSYYEQQYSAKLQSKTSEEQRKQGFLAFRVGDINLLMDLNYVAEIVKEMSQITPLPFSPKWLMGIVGLRGEVYSVIDLRTFFKASATNEGSQQSIYLVLSEQTQGYIFKVDNIIGIRDCDIEQFTSEQQFFNGQGTIDGEVFFKLNTEELTSDTPFIHSMQSN